MALVLRDFLRTDLKPLCDAICPEVTLGVNFVEDRIDMMAHGVSTIALLRRDVVRPEWSDIFKNRLSIFVSNNA